MPMPFEGIKILDLTIWQQGPVATMMLADMGADVIKIEQPIQGDPGRGLVWRGDHAPLNTYFECHNRNKRGLTLDLSKEPGQKVFYKLAEKADAFVHNLRPGVVERLKIDYQTLSGINPRLIYASGNGYGSKGPNVKKPSFDVIAQGIGGMLSVAGEPESAPPLVQVIGAADWISAAMLAFGIVTALYTRERTGIGQEVEVSLLGSQAAFGQLALQRYLFSGRSPGKVSRKTVANPLWNTYQAGDDKWLIIAALQADRYWPDFCKVLGIDHLIKDSRFDQIPHRREHAGELIEIVDKTFLTRTRDEWIKGFEAVDIPVGPVNDYGDLANDPQMEANDYIVNFNHPAAGPIKVVGPPVRLSKTPGSIRTGAPELGQHKEEVLLEYGFTWDDIAQLTADGMI